MTDKLIKETARAWNISEKKIRSVTFWIDKHISKERKSIVFVILLRRKYKPFKDHKH